MPDKICVPIKIVNNERWAQLSAYGNSHFICGEDFRQKKDISFAGGHRVRLYSVKANVHWKIPETVNLNIEEVSPATPPRRLPNR